MRQTMKRLTAVLLLFAMCFSVATPVSAATKKLTKTEKKKYSSILWNRQFKNDSGICSGTGTFLLYDVNNDGRKELIVSGMLGVMDRGATVVYSYDGSKFHKTSLDGYIEKVSKKGIETFDGAYSGSLYESTCNVYSVSKKGKGTLKLTYVHNSYLDSTKEKNTYYGSDSKTISKTSYNKQYNKYSFKEVGKTVKQYNVNKKNIINQLGIKASPKLSDGKYTTTHYGKSFKNAKNRSQCYKAYIKDNKLVLYGSYSKGSFGSGKASAVGIYTFDLSSCKYYIEEAEGKVTSSKDVFNDVINNTGINGVFDFVIKNGKVTKIIMSD